MTVIRPNSVSGITSITAQASEINVFRSDGALAGLQLNGVNFNTTAGVSTFATLNATTVSIGGTLTYEDVTNVDSVGVITARSTIDAQGDVSIADKIIHTGDTDTFIRFPSNDSFSVTTNNVTRMTFTGNFIDLPDAGTLRLGNSNDLQISHGSGGASNIVHSNTSQPLILSATGAGTIRFDTNSNERLKIDSNGYVGIKESSPHLYYSPDLVVKAGADAGGITIRSAGTSHNNYLMFADGNSGDTRYDGYIKYSHNNRNLQFATAAAVRLTIDSSGHIGIGTDNPAASLQGAWNRVLAISAGTSNGSMIRFIESSSAAGGSDTGLLVGQYNNNSYIVNYQNGFISLRTNNAERFVIGSSGQFGVAGANYGTAGQVLKSGGASAAPTWGSAGGETTEIYAYVSFGTTYDTNSGYITQDVSSLQSGNGITVDNSNSGERLTPTVAGKYFVMYMCNWLWSFSGGATFYNRITKNGSEQQRSTFSKYDPGSHTNITMCVMTMNGSSDYVQFQGYENKSGQAAYMGNLSRAVMFKLRD